MDSSLAGRPALLVTSNTYYVGPSDFYLLTPPRGASVLCRILQCFDWVRTIYKRSIEITTRPVWSDRRPHQQAAGVPSIIQLAQLILLHWRKSNRGPDLSCLSLHPHPPPPGSRLRLIESPFLLLSLLSSPFWTLRGILSDTDSYRQTKTYRKLIKVSFWLKRSWLKCKSAP